MSLQSVLTVLKDDDGTYNPAHVIAFLCTASYLCWGSYFVFKTHLIPEFRGLAEILGSCGIMNGGHKLTEIFRGPTEVGK